MNVRLNHRIAVALLCVLFLSVKAYAQETLLTICHTNDTHSCVEPINPLFADKRQANKGGYLRRMAWLEKQRETTPDLLLLDGGDFSQGSLYYTLYKGEVEVTLMNAMRYDAATIGNHEFDYGMENLARLCKLAEFPIVCSNYHFEGTPCEGLVKPYIIKERAGKRVAIIGVSPKLDGLVAASTCTGVVYEDPVAAVTRCVKEVEEQGVDLVILISHLGWEDANADIDDQRLIPQIRGIDYVVGGHSHTLFEGPRLVVDKEGHSIPVCQMGKNGQWVETTQIAIP
jgi:5'-nucleotidase